MKAWWSNISGIFSNALIIRSLTSISTKDALNYLPKFNTHLLAKFLQALSTKILYHAILNFVYIKNISSSWSTSRRYFWKFYYTFFFIITSTVTVPKLVHSLLPSCWPLYLATDQRNNYSLLNVHLMYMEIPGGFAGHGHPKTMALYPVCLQMSQI